MNLLDFTLCFLIFSVSVLALTFGYYIYSDTKRGRTFHAFNKSKEILDNLKPMEKPYEQNQKKEKTNSQKEWRSQND